mgnify:FL=1
MNEPYNRQQIHDDWRTRSLIPRFVIVRAGEHWAIGHHVATCNDVPVYSLTDEHYQDIADASAWVAAQQETTPTHED